MEMMELDFTDLKLSHNGALYALLGLLAAILFGVLGWFVLPDGKVLTWNEWQVFKQQRLYQRELTRLTRDADRLAALLDEYIPDPVRGQLVVEQVLANLNATTHPALKNQVDALLVANDAVYFWVLGTISNDEAIVLLDKANQTLVYAVEGRRPEPVEGQQTEPEKGKQ